MLLFDIMTVPKIMDSFSHFTGTNNFMHAMAPSVLSFLQEHRPFLMRRSQQVMRMKVRLGCALTPQWVMKLKVRLGCAQTPPVGHENENEAGLCTDPSSGS